MLIDLTAGSLPSTIEVGGRLFHIRTDYRWWITFIDALENGYMSAELAYSMIDEENVPPVQMFDEMVRKLVEFGTVRSITPRESSHSAEQILSYVEDGEYIYAAILQQYGVDITECELHWYKFRALVNSLKDTHLNDIMGWRGWTGNEQKGEKAHDAVMKKLHHSYRLKESDLSDDEKKLLDEFNNL